MKKTDERHEDAFTKEDKKTEGRMGGDEGKDGKDGGESKHEICVTTWNVNKSSAQYDFLSDMAQAHANVAMFQEAQNWHPDGAAEDLGWTLLKE